MALRFATASTQSVTIADAASLKPAAVSCMCWMKRNGITAGAEFMFCKGTTQSYGMAFAAGDPTLLFARNTTVLAYLSAGETVPDGIWTHIAGTYDPAANVAAIYINGVQKNTVADSAAITYNTEALILGGLDIASFTYNGDLDDMRIYNRQLTPNEIAAIYGAKGIDGMVRGLASRWLMKGKASGVVATGSGTIRDIGPGPANNGDPVNSPVYADSSLKWTRLVPT